VTLPSISSSAGYNTGFWSTSSSATSGTAAGTSISLSGNATYYARALDTTKPVWSLVSTSPSSGSASSLTITFKGTDTSGSVTSTLAVGNITVKVGSTTVSPTTKTLSGASNVTNGKQYTLTLGGFSTSGVVSITIAASTLKDGSSNTSNAATFTTNVTAAGPLNNYLISKSGSSSYDSASATLKNEPITVSHTAGAQQSGWSAADLTDYRYMGSTPNNYISFNGETWRIIGVFTVENESGVKEKRVKIVRNDSIGSYSFDTRSSTSCSTSSTSGSWARSPLKDVLNSGPYYNRTSGTCPNKESSGNLISCNFSSTGLTATAKNMIGQAKWYTSSAYEGQTASAIYTSERNSLTHCSWATNWVGAVGLMYPSDYGYASGTNSCLATKLNSYQNGCASSNWLFKSADTWTISPNNNGSVYVDNIGSTGKVYHFSATNVYAVRPSVYLKSNVRYTGGNGTSGSPYTIGL